MKSFSRILLLCSTLCVVLTKAQGSESPPSTPFELEAGASLEKLTKNYADWFTIYLDLVKKFDARTSLYGTMRQTDRFSLKDQEVLGGTYYPLGRTWTVVLEGSVSPTHKVLPRWTAMSEVQKKFDGGWILHVGLRHMAYTQANTDLAIVTTERYWSAFRASYTLYLARVAGEISSSHRVWGSWYYGHANSLNLSLSIGKEVEHIGGVGVLTSRVQHVSFFGKHWITPLWGIAYDVFVHKQGEFYSRRGIRIGIRFRF